MTREQAEQLRKLLENQTANMVDEQILQYPDFVEKWQSGKAYAVGKRLEYNGTIYKVLQAHTSQDTWTPPDAPSLFVKVLIPDSSTIPEWEGVKVSYPSGREMSIESATMMTVRTGISQCAGAIALKRMEELEWDTILVSAHVGARIGDGGNNPTNHFWWQGKFYSRTGKDKRFPDFRTSTGYGTVTGLCGVNCRHSFGSGDGENNPYVDINLSSEDNIKAEERAKKQRLMERRIRNSKREIQNLQTAIDASGDDKLKLELQQMYDRKSAVLRRQNKQYREFCKDNGLKEYSERLRVAQWDRSQAVRSAKAAQRYLNVKGDVK